MSELADFINSTVRATIKSVASAIVTAACNQPAPASVDLAGIGLQLQETNVNMANMTAAVGKCANSMASNNIAEHTLEACNRLTVRGGKLQGAVEKLNSACTRLANSVDQLTKAIHPQAGARRTLVHGLIQLKQDVANQMNCQGSQFRDVRSQFAGLIEDESRGVQTTALVRHILNIKPQVPTSTPEAEKENRSAQLAKEKTNTPAANSSSATPQQPLNRRDGDSQSGVSHPMKRIRFPIRPRTIMSPDRGLKDQILAIRRSLKQVEARPWSNTQEVIGNHRNKGRLNQNRGQQK